ncbi:MAG TPA: hypothetical protein DDZ73_01665, partial [Gammaproteobacteria bacterium]|nr:hypothetical protein [Gammaproteobacteria bacterium]
MGPTKDIPTKFVHVRVGNAVCQLIISTKMVLFPWPVFCAAKRLLDPEYGARAFLGHAGFHPLWQFGYGQVAP